MLTAAAFVPATPLVIPEVAQGAASELDDLRAACRQALAVLVASDPDVVVLVAVASVTGQAPGDAVGDLRGLGVDLAVAVDPGHRGPSVLSLGQTVGLWLLDDAAEGLGRRVVGVADDIDPAAALDLGRELVAGRERVALLVVGDGSAAQVAQSPRYVVPGALDADRVVAAALSGADLAALARWDAAAGQRDVVSGRAPWQVAAGAASVRTDGGSWRAECRYDAAPYGVTYLVVTWT